MKNKKIKELIENINQTNVKFNNCDIGATKFDGKAIDAINTIAEALDTQAEIMNWCNKSNFTTFLI